MVKEFSVKLFKPGTKGLLGKNLANFVVQTRVFLSTVNLSIKRTWVQLLSVSC